MRIKQLLPGKKCCCFYLLYSLTVLVFLLWFRFPADAVRTRIESDLSIMTPGLEWHISTIGLFFPADIRFGDIMITDKKKKEELFKIDAFSLRPD